MTRPAHRRYQILHYRDPEQAAIDTAARAWPRARADVGLAKLGLRGDLRPSLGLHIEARMELSLAA